MTGGRPNPEAAAKGKTPKRPVLRETILLVEDEREMREMLVALLKEDGYQVLVAANGEHALTLSEGYPGTIHLLVTDIMMPVMNGKELADRLCDLRPDIRVLFITGVGRADIWPLDICEDMADWLPKPFTWSQLRRKIRSILASRTGFEPQAGGEKGPSPDIFY